MRVRFYNLNALGKRYQAIPLEFDLTQEKDRVARVRPMSVDLIPRLAFGMNGLIG